jgi:hypothetical protein
MNFQHLVERAFSHRCDAFRCLKASALVLTSTLMISPVAFGGPLIDIVRAMPEGGWVRANTNKFSDVWPDSKDGPTPPYSPWKIIDSHSGFAWDSKRGDLILYGGGHASTAGNDVYRWRGSSQRWERSSLPSKVVGVGVGPLYNPIDGPDNAPASAHTYKNNVYLEVADRLLTFGGAAFNTGGNFLKQRADGSLTPTGPYLWDPAKADGSKVGGTNGSGFDPSVLGGQMWQNRDTWVNGLGPQPTIYVSGAAAYAKENGKDVVYLSAGQGGGSQKHLFRYTINNLATPTTDVWERIGINFYSAFSDQGVVAYDPVRKIYVRTGNGTRPFGYWDLNQPGESLDAPFTPAVLSGTYDFANSRNCGMEFDPVRSLFFIWCGGAQVWSMKAPVGALSPTGWQIGPELSAGVVAPGPIDTTGGVLGKWRYAPDLDAYMALKNQNDGEVWIYKPRAWQDPTGGVTPQEIIVDNAAVGIQDAAGGRTFTGTWCASTGAAPYGSNSLYSCGSVDSYRWTPQVAAAGAYDVYVRWTTHPNRSTAVPITVLSADGAITKTFNEQTGGGVWVLHGRYNFGAGSAGYIEVKNTNGQANADAVRLVPATSPPPPPPPPPIPEIVLDNAAAGVQDAAGGRTFTGTWCASSGTSPFGGNSIYSCGTAIDTYRWAPTIPTARNYDVYVWWTTHPNRSTNVPISVSHAGGTTVKNYNQQLTGGQWILHGRYNLPAGVGSYVEVSDANGQSAADAVRFVPVP